MTKDEMLGLLISDVEKWNAWRKETGNNKQILDLTGVDFPETLVLHDADLRCVDLSGCTAEGVMFMRCDFYRANLSKGRFFGTRFDQSLLFKVVAQDATFVGASFSRASLDNAQLQRSNFTGANLRQSDLSYVDATGANFSEASMLGTIVRDTKFHSAIIDYATLCQACLWTTAEGVAGILPQALDHLAQKVRRQIFPETDRLLRDCAVLAEEPVKQEPVAEKAEPLHTAQHPDDQPRVFERRGRISSFSHDSHGEMVNVAVPTRRMDGKYRDLSFDLPMSVFPTKDLAPGQPFELRIILDQKVEH